MHVRKRIIMLAYIYFSYQYYFLDFLYIFKIMKSLPNSGSVSPGSAGSAGSSAAKKSSIQRQSYVCYCAKIYNSYSALYLHAKKKHNQILSMKCLKKTKHEWSGNVKNIFYEFEQNSEQQSQKKSSGKISRRQKRIKTKKSKEEKTDAPLQMQILHKKLQKVVIEYKRQKTNVDNVIVIDQFINFIKQHYPFDSCADLPDNLDIKQNLDMVPYLMNAFMCGKSGSEQVSQEQMIRELTYFSDWLHQRKYTNVLAIPHAKYEQFFIEPKRQEC